MRRGGHEESMGTGVGNGDRRRGGGHEDYKGTSGG
jgi:hypothetical protein